MGRVIAVTNIKGGIGKTTTVVNVGAGLARFGARVLLVDVDAQGNLAIALGLTPKHTIYEALVDNAQVSRCIVQARPNLDLLPADDTLLGAQPIISRRSDWSRVLDHILQPIKKQYDFILVDSPGSLSVLSVNALMAAQEVIVPTTVEHLSIKGLAMLFKQIARITVGSSIVRVIVPTMFDPRLSQSHALLKQLQGTYGALITDPIRINVRLSEASWQGKTIFEYDGNSRGALDYANLVKRLCDAWEFRASAIDQSQSQQQSQQQDQQALASQQQHADTAKTHTNGTDQYPAGSPGSLPMKCPYCGRVLRRTTLAGYRVVSCDACSYRKQELISVARR